MRAILRVFLIVACGSILLAAKAEPVREINWNDLIPAHLNTQDFLADLDEDQRDMVHWVINMLESLPERGPGTEEFYQEIDEAMPTLKKVGIDIAAVMKKREELRTAVVDELNGQRVRIAGYLLPLEISREKGTDFLLVPYIGACIHVPPPPPNQIVRVRTVSKKGYRIKQIYEPVWVTGVMSAQSMVEDLFLVDGSAEVDIGYAIKAHQIDAYE